jgi:hypothetical protein
MSVAIPGPGQSWEASISFLIGVFLCLLQAPASAAMLTLDRHEDVCAGPHQPRYLTEVGRNGAVVIWTRLQSERTAAHWATSIVLGHIDVHLLIPVNSIGGAPIPFPRKPRRCRLSAV